MKHYSNISGASGVESYDYDSAFTYLVVKFKDGSILAFPSRLNSIDQIRSMCVFADMGVGLHRYINKNDPRYIEGVPADFKDVKNGNLPENNQVTKVNYPTYTYKNIRWNNGKDWVQIDFKDGGSKTYTIESCGKRNVINIIKSAIEGKGLKQYMDENKPTSVEETLIEKAK